MFAHNILKIISAKQVIITFQIGFPPHKNKVRLMDYIVCVPQVIMHVRINHRKRNEVA